MNMSFCTTSARVAGRITRQIESPVALLPAFLCPGFLHVNPAAHPTICRQHRRLHTAQESAGTRLETRELARALAADLVPSNTAKLPVQCPGCGALSQAIHPDEPGFYTLTRKSIRGQSQQKHGASKFQEVGILEKSLSALQESGDATSEQKSILGEFRSAFPSRDQKTDSAPLEPPVCDRCHNLKHHETGVSIHHPSVQSIQDTIFESPHKYNHIYHVIDAADFPMSLVQGLHKLLHLTPQRSLNRRSQAGKFFHGRKTEVSFVITRSDLLGPTKEHVDRLMPYLRSVVRDALGRAAQDARLGNLRCVSAKRQWWTKELKEDIWNRGGGGWMVGKVNVGKSQLFKEVFPKGRMGEWGKHTTISTKKDTVKVIPMRTVTEDEISNSARETSLDESASSILNHEMETNHGTADLPPAVVSTESLEASTQDPTDLEAEAYEPLDTTSLLPPLPTETSYPPMPLVSSLPGTTASPIRIPFGSGKGELIDLPGLTRSDLEMHVLPTHRSLLLMRGRPTNTSQNVLKPTQTLLLAGGLIRLTPVNPGLHYLWHNFTPLPVHQTATQKIEGVNEGRRESMVENWALDRSSSRKAGTFKLKWDVTKARTGPITRRDAAGIKVEKLPFRVVGTDILIEGVGWIEVAAQIRRPYGFLERESRKGVDGEDDVEGVEVEERDLPEIEVWSPEGRFVAQRRPMNASVLNGDRPGKVVRSRPRKAMKGIKKTEKRRAREGRVAALSA